MITTTDSTPFLFNMSIRKNFNLVNSNIKNQVDICKKIGIHDYIANLSKGYNTVIDSDVIPYNIRQLIALARTFLSKAKIIILDDITLGLDKATITYLLKIYQTIKKEYTIVIITKDTQILRKVDNIIVVDKGKIVGNDKHKNLVNNNDIYKNIYYRKSSSKLGVVSND